MRMASTSAKNRVLQDACNIPQALAELDERSFDTEAVPVSRSHPLPAGEGPFIPEFIPKSSSSGKGVPDKQIIFINSLASGQGKEADDESMARFGKSVDMLSKKEAGALIKGLLSQ